MVTKFHYFHHAYRIAYVYVDRHACEWYIYKCLHVCPCLSISVNIMYVCRQTGLSQYVCVHAYGHVGVYI